MEADYYKPRERCAVDTPHRAVADVSQAQKPTTETSTIPVP